MYLAFTAYIKFRYPFWSRMKIQHSYNVLNRFYRIGIIDTSPLDKSRWTNDKNIKIFKAKNITKNQQKSITAFIRKHKELNNNTINLIDRHDLSSCIDYNNKEAFVGLYYEKHHVCIKEDSVLGIVIARPFSVRINNKFFTTYLIDNLLVDKKRIKHVHEISPQLIYSIILEQQQTNSARTCLFVREGNLNIPTKTFLSYSTYFFESQNWNSLKSSFSIISSHRNRYKQCLHY